MDYDEKSEVLGRVLIDPKQYQGQGWGEMMIQLALHIVFDDLGLVKIDLGVFAFNKPAIQNYHRFGFKIYKTIPKSKNDK